MTLEMNYFVFSKQIVQIFDVFLDIMMNNYKVHLFSFVGNNGRNWRSLKNSD